MGAGCRRGASSTIAGDWGSMVSRHFTSARSSIRPPLSASSWRAAPGRRRGEAPAPPPRVSGAAAGAPGWPGNVGAPFGCVCCPGPVACPERWRLLRLLLLRSLLRRTPSAVRRKDLPADQHQRRAQWQGRIFLSFISSSQRCSARSGLQIIARTATTPGAADDYNHGRGAGRPRR
jgi:hypothetical protein